MSAQLSKMPAGAALECVVVSKKINNPLSYHDMRRVWWSHLRFASLSSQHAFARRGHAVGAGVG